MVPGYGHGGRELSVYIEGSDLRLQTLLELLSGLNVESGKHGIRFTRMS